LPEGRVVRVEPDRFRQRPGLTLLFETLLHRV
jgi:hypothetical protein